MWWAGWRGRRDAGSASLIVASFRVSSPGVSRCILSCGCSVFDQLSSQPMVENEKGKGGRRGGNAHSTISLRVFCDAESGKAVRAVEKEHRSFRGREKRVGENPLHQRLVTQTWWTPNRSRSVTAPSVGAVTWSGGAQGREVLVGGWARRVPGREEEVNHHPNAIRTSTRGRMFVVLAGFSARH